jgi:hypothetical protein
MNPPKKRAWADAYQNQDLISVSTCSGYRSCAYDPQGKDTLLDINVGDDVLGRAVLESLARSRFLTLAEVPAFFDCRQYPIRYAAWVQSLMKAYKYKTKSALFREMESCNIESCDGIIRITPMRHKKLEAWGRDKDDGIEDVLIPAGSSPERIGAALRLGFSLCVELSVKY